MINRKVGPTGVELPPNPARLVQILAAVGHTMPSAVADLIDNSISADATRIEITFGRPDGGNGRWLKIADNGRGMTRSQLEEAMRIGSGAEYDKNALGKYGYGLKGASWSQAKVFSVATKCASKPAHHLTWDADDMDGWIAKSDPLDSKRSCNGVAEVLAKGSTGLSLPNCRCPFLRCRITGTIGLPSRSNFSCWRTPPMRPAGWIYTTFEKSVAGGRHSRIARPRGAIGRDSNSIPCAFRRSAGEDVAGGLYSPTTARASGRR